MNKPDYRRAFLAGFGSVFGAIGAAREYQKFHVPARGEGFAQDRAKLAGDARRVAGDMTNAVEEAKRLYQVK